MSDPAGLTTPLMYDLRPVVTQRETFNGLALAIVRGKGGQAGKISVRAEAAGLEFANIPVSTTRL